MLAQGQVNGHNVQYLSEENFTCPDFPKWQIMHKHLSLALTVLILNLNFYKNSMKPETQLKTV